MRMKGNLSRMMSRTSEINLENSTEKKLLLLWECGLRVYIKSKYVQYIIQYAQYAAQSVWCSVQRGRY